MSLTSFISISDVRARFTKEFIKPKFEIKKSILSPPLSKAFSLIGTSFDYLLRFYIQKLNPGSLSDLWVAASGPFHIKLILGMNNTLAKQQYNRAMAILEEATKLHQSYVTGGEMNDDLIRHSILLAHLDLPYRAGRIPDFKVENSYIDELRHLLSIVDPNKFKANKVCILNPKFGDGSSLVRGADGDIAIDNMLIDIKTVKNLSLDRDHLNQMIGYYILSKIGGIDGSPPGHEIDTIGLYYSRYAELYTIPIKNIITEEQLANFIDWFKKRARKAFSEPSET